MSIDTVEKAEARIIELELSLARAISKIVALTRANFALEETNSQLKDFVCNTVAANFAKSDVDLLIEYVVAHGGDHEDECPLDDTCDCKFHQRNHAVNRICHHLEELCKHQ